MSYPTNSLQSVLQDIDRRLIGIKNRAGRDRATLSGGSTSATTIIDVFKTMRGDRVWLDSVKSTAGLPQYSKDIKNDQTLDIVTEFNSVLSAMDSVTLWIETNFPVDGSGFLLKETFTANGTNDRQFTPSQTAGLVAALDTLTASIE